MPLLPAPFARRRILHLATSIEVPLTHLSSIAKDPNVRTSARLRAAGNAVKDAVNEGSHKRTADVNKQAAKHNY
jgi:hypothetical protein